MRAAVVRLTVWIGRAGWGNSHDWVILYLVPSPQKILRADGNGLSSQLKREYNKAEGLKSSSLTCTPGCSQRYRRRQLVVAHLTTTTICCRQRGTRLVVAEHASDTDAIAGYPACPSNLRKISHGKRGRLFTTHHARTPQTRSKKQAQTTHTASLAST